MKKLFIFIAICNALLLACLSETNATTIYAGQDGYVNEQYPTALYGSGISLAIRSQVNYRLRSYLQFNLSEIPDDSVITSATLQLNCSNNSSSGAPVEVYRTGSFSEGTLTWSNQPGLSPSYALSSITLIAGWNSWDILTLWNYGPDLGADNLSLSVRFSDETVSGHYASFWSREYAGTTYDPRLQIEVQAIPIPGAVWLLGSGLIGIVGIRRKYKK